MLTGGDRVDLSDGLRVFACAKAGGRRFDEILCYAREDDMADGTMICIMVAGFVSTRQVQIRSESRDHRSESDDRQ